MTLTFPLKENLVFTVGSFIKLSTVHGEIITGEVLAFQYELKLIVLSKLFGLHVTSKL